MASRYKKPCKKPIISYGLIVFSVQDGVPYFVIYQRRDTFEYMDFIRGIRNTNNLQKSFMLMSREEKERIMNYSFEELWNDLWVNHNFRLYKVGYMNAKRKFEEIAPQLPSLIEETKEYTKEPHWGFPKGKKSSPTECPINCAFREFYEETKISLDRYKLISNEPLVEEFKGSNGRTYITHYYAVSVPDIIPIQYMDTPQCIRKRTVSEEASHVRWVTYNEARDYININRQDILFQVKGAIDRHLSKL